MIIAKPVIDKKFWILQKDNEKVGNIEATAGGYQVCIENKVEQYKTIRMAAQRANIHFETGVVKSKPSIGTVHGYPVTGRVYNPVWDVPHHLPLYTKTKKSKSWFAAGWYTVKRGRKWKIVQDPKLITLERYAFHGPFYTKESASTYTHD
jgi:hypothetical protein